MILENNFYDKVKEVVDIDRKLGIDSGIFCIQELSELIIEITEFYRKGGDIDKIFNEAVDSLLTIIILLESLDILNIDKIKDRMEVILESGIQKK